MSSDVSHYQASSWIKIPNLLKSYNKWSWYQEISRILNEHPKQRSGCSRTSSEKNFRIVHLSIQRTHVHLLVEANSKGELASGDFMLVCDRSTRDGRRLLAPDIRTRTRHRTSALIHGAYRRPCVSRWAVVCAR